MKPDAPPRLRVGMASYGDLAFDSRVQREAMALAEAGHQVTLLCVEPGGELPPSLVSAVTVIARYPKGRPIAPGPGRAARLQGVAGRVGRMLARAVWLLRYQRDTTRWGHWAVRTAGVIDAWHLHDFPALAAVAPRLAENIPFVYDSHEVYLESGTAARLPAPIRALLGRRERQLARRATALVTVNDACAAALSSLGVARTVVVHNYPQLPPVITPAGMSPLRAAAGVPDGAPIVLSHGAITTDRGLEQLVAALAQPELSGVHLVVLGYGSLGRTLLEQGRSIGVGERVHILPAVAPDDVLTWVAGADISAMPIQPTTLNHVLSTPNKLFESLGAGVPVVASDFPGMASVVLDAAEGPLGVVCDPTDVASIAAAIDGLLRMPEADRAALRDRCRAAALDRMTWPHAAARLVALYDERPPAAA